MAREKDELSNDLPGLILSMIVPGMIYAILDRGPI
jgi:hypothetical protein